MKYHIITLGCQMNVSDSERVKAVLDEKMGYTWTDNEEEAQIVGIMLVLFGRKPLTKCILKLPNGTRLKTTAT